LEKVTIVVTKSKILDEKTNKERLCKYSDVPMDKNHWVHDLKYMPIPYDLMHLRIKGVRKVKSGWWNGTVWKGLKLDPDDEIIAWKRNQDFEQKRDP